MVMLFGFRKISQKTVTCQRMLSSRFSQTMSKSAVTSTANSSAEVIRSRHSLNPSKKRSKISQTDRPRDANPSCVPDAPSVSLELRFMDAQYAHVVVKQGTGRAFASQNQMNTESGKTHRMDIHAYLVV